MEQPTQEDGPKGGIFLDEEEVSRATEIHDGPFDRKSSASNTILEKRPPRTEII